MKKKFYKTKPFKFIIAVILIAVVYLAAVVCFRNYVSRNKKITFFGTGYTELKNDNTNFTPFGDYNFRYDIDVKYKNILGMSFDKNDSKKNLLYYKTVLGTTVYKKDGYNLPEIPEIDVIDELIIDNSNGTYAKVTDKNEIVQMYDFFLYLNAADDTQAENKITVYAVSYEYGGIFKLNDEGEISIGENNILYSGWLEKQELPTDIQNIILKYINS